MRLNEQLHFIRRGAGHALLAGAFALGLVGGFATPAAAEPVKPPYARPPAGSPPDLSGAWLVSGGLFAVKTADGQPVPIQPWADAVNKKALGDQIANMTVDLETKCLPNGGTDVMYIPYTYFFVETRDTIVILQEYNHQSRTIHMNAKHPAKLAATWDGHSIGHWEGETLVVDTVGFDDEAPLMTSAAKAGAIFRARKSCMLLSVSISAMAAKRSTTTCGLTIRKCSRVLGHLSSPMRGGLIFARSKIFAPRTTSLKVCSDLAAGAQCRSAHPRKDDDWVY